MNIIFINNKLFFLSVILAFIAGCSDGSKSSGGPVVGIADLSPGIAVNSSVDVEEGDDGSQIAAVGFTASTDGIVNYTTYDIDAVAKSDYLPQSGQYEMQAGQSYEIGIEILSDTRVEADEKVGILITDESGEELGRLVATILNDDYPNYTLTASDITEGHLGTQFLEFTIELSEPTVAPFPLTVTTTDLVQVGSALAGTDYTAINSELVFVAGELSKTVEVEVFGDRDIEPNETIELKVDHLGKSELAVTGVIRSDDTPGDGAPTFRFNNGLSLTVDENAEAEQRIMTFKIDENGGFTEDFVVNYRLSSLADEVEILGADKAEEGDYGSTVGQVAISAVQGDLANEYTAAFEIIDDDLLENNEVLEMVLFNEAGVVFGSGRIYIVDNESPEFKIYRQYTDTDDTIKTSTDLTYIENSDFLGQHEFYVELAGEVGYDYDFEFVLRYATSLEAVKYGTAIDFSDLVGAVETDDEIISRPIKIEKGNSRPTADNNHAIGFLIEEETLVEANEVMMIELRNSNGGSIGEAIPVYILNDDFPRVRWANTADLADPTNFKAAEEDGLNLLLQLSNDDTSLEPISYTGLALQDFEVVVDTLITENPNPTSCDASEQVHLSEDELSISTQDNVIVSSSDVLDFIDGALNVPFELDFSKVAGLEDKAVECDEVVDLQVTLQSKDERIKSYLASLDVREDRSDRITVTAVNKDTTSLSVTGFSVVETDGTTEAKFQVELNSNIGLNATFKITTDGVEDADGIITFDGLTDSNTGTIELGEGGVFVFPKSGEKRIQEVTILLNQDSIVELDESYELTVTLPDLAAVVLNDCGVGDGLCSEKAADVRELSVKGTVDSLDKAVITIEAKSLPEKISESLLTELALINSDISNPYIYRLNNPIASDVPTISLQISNRCLIEYQSICADFDDFLMDITNIHNFGTSTVAGVGDLQLKLLKNDDTVEPDETIMASVSLVNLSVVEGYVEEVINAGIDYDILNDDQLTLTFSDNSNIEYQEGDSGTKAIADTVTWNADIAANVEEISFTLNEICEKSDVVVCVENQKTTDGLAFNGDLFFPEKLILHDGLSKTTIRSKSVGVDVKGDDLIESNEKAIISIVLNNETNTQPYIKSPWVNRTIHFQINNNDTFSPALTFSGTVVTVEGVKVSAEGNEGDEGKTQNVELLLTWAAGIASNVPAIEFNIVSVCTAETVSGLCDGDILKGGDVDYTYNNTYNLENKSSAGSATLNLLINGNVIVEPNETITFKLQAASEDDHHFFPVDYFSNENDIPTAIYKVLNDDKLSIVIENSSLIANSIREDDIDSGYSITWDKEIAKNVPGITLQLSETCDESSGNLDDHLCIITEESDDALGVTGDVSFLNEFTVHAGSKAKNTPKNISGSSLSIEVVGDLVVEPNENAEITIELENASDLNQMYLNQDWSDSMVTFKILNDDVISPTLVFTNVLDVDGAKLAEGSFDEDSKSDIGLTLGWDAPVASNVRDLNLVISSVCKPKFDGELTGLSTSCDSITDKDYIHAAGYDLTNKTIEGTAELSFTIEDNSIVEPDEMVDLSLSLGISPSHYFPVDFTWPVVSYEILNDDKLTLTYYPGADADIKEGDDNVKTVGQTISWDADIASNVPELSFTLSEVCALISDDVCVDNTQVGNDDTGFTYSGDLNFSGKLIIHDGVNKTTARTVGTGVEIKGDTLIESIETAIISIVLNDKLTTQPFLEMTWADRTLPFKIKNDDTFSPTLIFAETTSTTVGQKVNAEGNEDESQSVELHIAWSAGVATNIPAIEFLITSNCVADSTNSSCDSNTTTGGDADFSYSNAYSFNDKTAAGTESLSLNLVGNDVVEPNEVITFKLQPVSNDDKHYFPLGYFDDLNNLPTAEYTVINDDKLTVSITNDSLIDRALSEADVDAGYTIAWDKEIAKNVPQMSFQLTETCNEVSGAANDHLCVVTKDSTDLLAVEGDLSFNKVFILHDPSKGNNTPHNVSGTSLEINVVEDFVVEPHEKAEVTVALNNSSSLNGAYLLNSWANSVLTFEISNDDVVSPSLVFTNVQNSEGVKLSDGSFSEDAKSNVGLTLGWDVQVADNVTDLNLIIAPICTPSYVGEAPSQSPSCDSGSHADFVATTSYALKDKASAGNENLTFSISGNSVVEPDETVTLTLEKDSSPAHYFPDSFAFPSVSYKILNDDKLSVVIREGSPSVVEGAGVDGEEQDTGYKLTWDTDKDIAKNVPTISFSLRETCDESHVTNGTTNQQYLCVDAVANADGSGRFEGDITFNNVVELHTFATQTNASVSEKSLGVKVNEDSDLEPSENAEIILALIDGSSFTPYFVDGWKNTAWDEASVYNFEVTNNDTFMPSLVFTRGDQDIDGNNITTTSLGENAAADVSNGIGITLGWSDAIGENIRDIEFILTASCASENTFTMQGSNESSSACSLGVLDYTTNITNYSLTNKASDDKQYYTFSVNPDAVVEPNEIITFSLALSGGTPEHYFTDIQKLPSAVFTITNDDFLSVTVNENVNDVVVDVDANTIVSQLTESDVSIENPIGIDANYKISWDKIIAFNVPSINFTLSETCNEGSDTKSKCIVTTTSNDGTTVTGDVGFATTVSLHSEGKVDGGNTPAKSDGLGLGIAVISDNTIEPNEQANISVSLNNPVTINSFIDTTKQWADKALAFQLLNDDTFTPVFTFEKVTGTLSQTGVYSVSANENATEDHPGIWLGWGGGFASNMDNIAFSFIPTCLPVYSSGQTYVEDENYNCGSSSDYEDYDSTSIFTLTYENVESSDVDNNSTTKGSIKSHFHVVEDSIVEPDEKITFQLTVPENVYHYFDNPTNLPSAEYTIINDDFLGITIAGSTASFDEGSGDTGYKIKWDHAIDKNVPPIVISLADTCDGAKNNCIKAEPVIVGGVITSYDRDVTFPSTYTLHAGTSNGLTSKNTSGDDLNIVINDDAVVEVEETAKMTFTLLDSANAGINSSTYFGGSTGWAAVDKEFSIAVDDTIKIASTVTSADEGASASIKLEWNEKIASNVPEITINLGLVCDTAIDGCEDLGTHADYVAAVTSRVIVPSASTESTAGGFIEYPVSIKGDDYIEKDEKINISFTPDSATYLDGTIAATSITIPNDDFIKVSLTNTANLAQETLGGGIKVVWADSYRVEGYSSFKFDIKTILTGDLTTTDFDITGCTENSGVLTCAFEVSLLDSATNPINLVANNEAVMPFKSDDHIEVDETATLTISQKLGEAPISAVSDIAASLSNTFTIMNDDFLVFSYGQGAATVSGADATSIMNNLKHSFMLEEGAASTSIKLYVCNPSNETVTGGDIDLSFTFEEPVSGVEAAGKSNSRLHNASPDDYTKMANQIVSIQTLPGSTCKGIEVIDSFSVDSTSEPHEWLRVTADPNSGNDTRCEKSGECFGPLLNDNNGLIVIANDDFGIIVDSGNDQCVLADGTLADGTLTDGILSCLISGQDIENTNIPALSYVKLTASGTPTLGSDYACIADGSTGHVWSRYGIEAADLTNANSANDSGLIGSEVQYSWGAAPDASTMDVSKLKYCGRSDWVLPSITDLMNVADYEYLNDANPQFVHQEYWSSDSCWVDADGTSPGHWALNFVTGESDCLADSSPLYLRAISKN